MPAESSHPTSSPVSRTRRSPLLTRRLAAATLFFLTASCATDAGGPASDLPPGTPLEIAETASLAVGVLEGDSLEELDRVRAPFLLPDGRLVVPLAAAGVMRVFDAGGLYLTTLGGRGEGPGEFMSVSTAWARGDTVEAFDGRLRRITRFPPDGSHEVVSFTSAPGYVDSAVRGWSPGGWLLYGLVAGGAGRRDRIAVHHFARDGTHVGEVAQIDGMRRFQAGSAGGPTPLSPSAWLELHQGLFYLAEALDPVVRVLDSTGAVVREITWPPAPSASPEEALAAVIDSVAASEGSLFPPEYLGAAPVPDRLPLFWGFLVDDEGFVWVRRYDPLRNAAALGGLAGAGAGGEWLLFTPEGAPAGAIRVPEALAPSQITSDALVGIHRDQLGVESVRVHPLRRAPG